MRGRLPAAYAWCAIFRSKPGSHSETSRSLKLAEQTRSCDYDPCDEGGEAGEQQQIMQDDGHGKCPYAAAGARTNIWAGI
jgi:hypothetical protein